MANTKITANVIAANAILAVSIADENITSAKLADLAVTEGKIANSAITADKIATDAVIAAKIQNGAITSAKLDTNIAIGGTLGVTGNITGTLATAAQPNITSVGTIASLVATTADINGGTVDGTVIGGTTAAAGTFTTVTASGDVDAVNATLSGYLRGPTNFTIDPAAHGDNTGTLIIAGNLQVDGTTTTINSTTLTVDDLNLTLASGAADAAAANGAGITVDGASATLLYASTGDKFVFNKGLDVTGNIGVTGTVDGRDVAADGTKLDGVEALADVTDATNVTAAGALMDSELTSIASVKAINQGLATGDSVTFAGVTDGYITWNAAQLNRYGAAIELQFTPTNAATLVKIGANGSYPTIFNAYNGNATIPGTVLVGDGSQSAQSDADITVRRGVSFAGIDLKSTRTSGNTGGIRSYNASNVVENQLLFEVGGRVNLYNSSGFAINGTTVIDSSRNLTNIGTISSGAINVNSAGAGGIAGFRGNPNNQVNIAHSGNASWGMLLTNSDATNNSGYHKTTSGINSSIAMVNVSNDALHLGTNNTDRMTIDHNGNVGIGTSSPASRLNILGGALPTAGTGVQINGNLNAGRLTSGDAGTLQALSTYYDAHAYEISAGSSSGYVSGIVIGARSYTGAEGDAVSFFTRSAERMRITSTGYVAIGGSGAFSGTPENTLSLVHDGHGLGFDYVSSLPRTAGLYTSSNALTQTAWGDLNIKARSDYGGYYGIGLFTASSNSTPVKRLSVNSTGTVTHENAGSIERIRHNWSSGLGSYTAGQVTQMSQDTAYRHAAYGMYELGTVTTRAFGNYVDFKTNLTSDNIMFMFYFTGYQYNRGTSAFYGGGYTYNNNSVISKDVGSGGIVVGPMSVYDIYRSSGGNLCVKLHCSVTGYDEGRTNVFFMPHGSGFDTMRIIDAHVTNSTTNYY